MSPPSRENAARRRYIRRVRDEVLDMLGAVCAHCGFSDRRALQVDHVHGGGSCERRREGRDPIALRRLVRANPAAYQVLCANCNWIKRVENHENGAQTGRLSG